MSRIKSKDTRPEIIVRRYLDSVGFRCKYNVSNLPGKPDIVLPKYKIVIFVNGCFWHRHKNCKRASIPKSNKRYWINKFEYNQKKDIVVKKALRRFGYKVLIIWECQTKKQKYLNKILNKLEQIRNDFR